MSLNTLKPYYTTQIELLGMQIDKKEVKNSFIYRELLKSIKENNIFIKHIKSFCHKDFPKKIRVRGNSFLKQAKYEGPESVLLAGYKINGINKFIIISSKWFTTYNKSLHSSNSFFMLDSIKELKDIGNFTSEIITKNVNGKTKYIYCCINQKSTNAREILNFYLNGYKNINLNYYNLDVKNDPAIPESTKRDSNVLYDFKCSFLKIKKCLDPKINYSKSKSLGFIPYEYHHIVPRNWFKKSKNLNWRIIHSSINIHNLCQLDHKCTISQDVKNKEIYFNNLIELYKKFGLMEKFNHYLHNDCKITLNILANIYRINQNYE